MSPRLSMAISAVLFVLALVIAFVQPFGRPCECPVPPPAGPTLASQLGAGAACTSNGAFCIRDGQLFAGSGEVMVCRRAPTRSPRRRRRGGRWMLVWWYPTGTGTMIQRFESKGRARRVQRRERSKGARVRLLSWSRSNAVRFWVLPRVHGYRDRSHQPLWSSLERGRS